MNKRALLNLVIEDLQKEEQVLIEASNSAREAATEVEAKPENKYDTRGLEQSYLAAGQAKRAIELKASIQVFRDLHLVAFENAVPIDISALVKLDSEDGESKTYFILPERGGIKIQYEGEEIATLSPESPLAKSLMGKKTGDSIEVKIKDQIRSFSIVSVL